MKTCDKCNGDGLIGNGPNPHLKQGRIGTCDQCSGTGKIAEVSSEPAQAGDSIPETPESSETVEEPKKTSFFDKVFGA